MFVGGKGGDFFKDDIYWQWLTGDMRSIIVVTGQPRSQLKTNKILTSQQSGIFPLIAVFNQLERFLAFLKNKFLEKYILQSNTISKIYL